MAVHKDNQYQLNNLSIYKLIVITRGVGPVVLELVAQLLVVVLVLRRGRVLKAVLLVVIAEK